ncbi:MAG: DNA translocase FtsK [Chloroflexi bacterium]|nr:MAG: DNA translocase FtsK [Chloroflexota bacterium]
MRTKLEFMSDRIEAVLAQRQMPARVTGGTVTPRWVRFQVLPAVGAKISKIKELSEELAAALNVPTCRVSRRGAAVAVEIPRDDPQPVRLLPLYRQLDTIPRVTATLGLAEDGAPLLIRLPSPDVGHVLVTGDSGAGKTTLLQTMILSLAMANPVSDLNFVLVDLKGRSFQPFAGLPHLARPVIEDAGEAAEAVRSLTRLMEQRNSNGHNTHATTVLVIDELSYLHPPAINVLNRLAQRGHQAGIHIIAATQSPSLLPGFRLVGKTANATGARAAAGLDKTRAERLMGRGDFLAVAEGRVTRFQVAYVSPDEIKNTVEEVQRGPTR